MYMLKSNPKTILFLGYDKKQTKIINELELRKHKVTQISEEIDKISNNFDLVISFGYRYILTRDILSDISVPIINLHLSYLPWNKGAHPNFWAFWDNTPSGVTIHLIEPGIDSGPILFQKIVEFEEYKETFRTSYEKLFSEIENMFINNIDNILTSNFKSKIQRGKGSIHYVRDFPSNFSGWDSKIYDEINRLEKLGFNPNHRLLTIIDEIENVRSSNNINWMNLLRIVAIEAPDKLFEITKKINQADGEISKLFRKLND